MYKLVLIIGCIGALLCGCAHQPQSYCHQLATKINSYQHTGMDRAKTNPAERATLVQQYKSLDCED